MTIATIDAAHCAALAEEFELHALRREHKAVVRWLVDVDPQAI